MQELPTQACFTACVEMHTCAGAGAAIPATAIASNTDNALKCRPLLGRRLNRRICFLLIIQFQVDVSLLSMRLFPGFLRILGTSFLEKMTE